MKKVLSLLLASLLIFGLTAQALAVEIVPSAEANPAPTFVPFLDPDGKEALAVITNADGTKTYIHAGDNPSIVLTALSQKDSAPNATITQMLNDAEIQIKQSSSVADLTADMIAALKAYQEKSTDPQIKAIDIEDLCITALFDVSFLLNGTEMYELPEGAKITFSIQTNLTAEDLFFILHDYEGANWEVVEAYELSDDGVLTMTLSSLSPLALVSYNKTTDEEPDGKKEEEKKDEPTSPPTGENSEIREATYAVCGLIFAVSAVMCLRNARRRRNAED